MKQTLSEETIKRSQVHALRYWFTDGLGELSIGFFFLLAAIIYYLQETAPGSLLSKIFSIVSVILVFGAAFGGRWMIQRIKERITYPRTGYVDYESGWKNKSANMIAIGAMALLFVFVVYTTVIDTKLANWGPVVGGLFAGIIMAQAGYRFALPRLYILAFLGLLIGAGLVISGLSLALSLPLFWGLDGLILLASGGITLWKYLHQSPVSPESPDEH